MDEYVPRPSHISLSDGDSSLAYSGQDRHFDFIQREEDGMQKAFRELYDTTEIHHVQRPPSQIFLNKKGVAIHDIFGQFFGHRFIINFKSVLDGEIYLLFFIYIVANGTSSGSLSCHSAQLWGFHFPHPGFSMEKMLLMHQRLRSH